MAAPPADPVRPPTRLTAGMPPPTGSLARGLASLELLAEAGQGVSLGTVASTLNIPKAAAHRSLSELVECGFAQQQESQGDYSLSLRFVSLALRYLGQRTLVDLAKPALQRLAEASEELVRLCLVENDVLYWVDKRQGTKRGLRFDDPDTGAEVRLSKSATGIAWLASLPRERAMQLVSDQDDRWEDEPVAPAELLNRIQFVHDHGFAFSDSTYEVGLAGMAVPILPSTGEGAVGLLSIAGPSVRFTLEQATRLAPLLQAEAAQLAAVSASS